MNGEAGEVGDDRTWDLLSRAEEDTLGWIRDLRDEDRVRRGCAEPRALLAALAEAGAEAVGAPERDGTGTRHGFRRGDVEFSIELDAETPALIRIRFGRVGS